MKIDMTKEEIHILIEWFELVEQEIGTLNRDEILYEKLIEIVKSINGEENV